MTIQLNSLQIGFLEYIWQRMEQVKIVLQQFIELKLLVVNTALNTSWLRCTRGSRPLRCTGNWIGYTRRQSYMEVIQPKCTGTDYPYFFTTSGGKYRLVIYSEKSTNHWRIAPSKLTSSTISRRFLSRELRLQDGLKRRILPPAYPTERTTSAGLHGTTRVVLYHCTSHVAWRSKPIFQENYPLGHLTSPLSHPPCFHILWGLWSITVCHIFTVQNGDVRGHCLPSFPETKPLPAPEECNSRGVHEVGNP